MKVYTVTATVHKNFCGTCWPRNKIEPNNLYKQQLDFCLPITDPALCPFTWSNSCMSAPQTFALGKFNLSLLVATWFIVVLLIHNWYDWQQISVCIIQFKFTQKFTKDVVRYTYGFCFLFSYFFFLPCNSLCTHVLPKISHNCGHAEICKFFWRPTDKVWFDESVPLSSVSQSSQELFLSRKTGIYFSAKSHLFLLFQVLNYCIIM